MHCLAMKPCRFNELKHNIESITQKMLTQELRAMERDGLVKREQFSEMPPRVEYSLTELGRTLTVIFEQIKTWRPNLTAVAKARGEYDDR